MTASAVAQEFLLPDVGEGLTEAEIVTWHVAAGDRVEVNQVLVEIETAKSLVELPSPYAGEVLALLVDAGTTAEVGTPIIRIGERATATAPAAPTVPQPSVETAGSDAEPKLLVGYGARADSHSPRRRPAPAAPVLAIPQPDAVPQPGAAISPDSSGGRPRAKPPVRKLAKALGVDLAAVTASGTDGTVTRHDVEQAARARQVVPTSAPASGSGTSNGLETRIPIKGVRKQTAAAMVASAFTAPHVTEFVTIDLTRTLELREQVQQRRDFRDVKLTPLTFVARAYLLALTRTPMATARWDEAAQEIVLPASVNLGIAAATPRGLVVPNIKDAARLSLRDLAVAIGELAATARSGKTPPESFTGGNTTITNVGVFGVDTGTPILNPGEAAILAVGAVRRMPWVVGRGDQERLEPRSVLQLALSFDHRVIDGQEGSQVLADTAEILTQPGLALL